MVSAVLAIALSVVVIAMATLGAVLLVRFALGGQSRSRRVFAAALVGPGLVLMPVFAIALVGEGAFSGSIVVGFGVLLAASSGFIGWPIAHFATARLDRLTRFDPQVFE